MTPRCLLVQYFVSPYIGFTYWPVAEWCRLSFSSPELLAHAVGSRFQSCQWVMFLTSTFILSTQIINYPTPLPIIMDAQLPHNMVKSAVLPKTTSLCASIIVITLWGEVNWVFYETDKLAIQ